VTISRSPGCKSRRCRSLAGSTNRPALTEGYGVAVAVTHSETVPPPADISTIRTFPTSSAEGRLAAWPVGRPGHHRRNCRRADVRPAGTPGRHAAQHDVAAGA
jgi:hypothetical protein